MKSRRDTRIAAALFVIKSGNLYLPIISAYFSGMSPLGFFSR